MSIRAKPRTPPGYRVDMRAAELRLDALLDFAPDGGLITFAGRRALIFDAVALGLLRQQLVELLGLAAARGVLTRFGYAHGWRTAEAMRDALPWAEAREWRIAGGRLHRLQGLVRFEPVDDVGDARAAARWIDSFEAEQHRLHLGPADAPVCWSLTGFASGYLSAVHQTPIYALEIRCAGCGAADCRMEARTAAQWGPRVEPVLADYDPDCLDAALRAVQSRLLDAEAALGRTRRAVEAAQARSAPPVQGLVAKSPQMQRAVQIARRAARVDSTVLVTGPSGSGKERIARLVHDASRRAEGPFVAVNCGAIPDTLVESELFGHARGAFTGASTDRLGLFEAAERGTLLLDEVGELPPQVQVKLLRVLQERRVRRVGETTDRPVDVRIVAATHRDLQAEVAAGRFREDLFYRLRVVRIALAPLAERRADILPLARRFLETLRAEMGCPAERFDHGAVAALSGWRWPGNVRELRNAVEFALVMARGEAITLADLPPEIAAAAAPAAPRGSERLADVERAHIEAVLAAAEGNRTAAAGRLGIGVSTLYRKLKAWGPEDS